MFASSKPKIELDETAEPAPGHDFVAPVRSTEKRRGPRSTINKLPKVRFDGIDRKILNLKLFDPDITNEQIGEIVGKSHSVIALRLRRLASMVSMSDPIALFRSGFMEMAPVVLENWVSRILAGDPDACREWRDKWLEFERMAANNRMRMALAGGSAAGMAGVSLLPALGNMDSGDDLSKMTDEELEAHVHQLRDSNARLAERNKTVDALDAGDAIEEGRT